MRHLHHCLALMVDFSTPQSQSRLLTQPIINWSVPVQLDSSYGQVQAELTAELGSIQGWLQQKSDRHVVMALSFEAWQILGAGRYERPNTDRIHLNAKQTVNDFASPWLEAMGFEHVDFLNKSQTIEWLSQHAKSIQYLATAPEFLIEQSTFCQNVERIREWIAGGDTYQVNFTFPMRSSLLMNSEAELDQSCFDSALLGEYLDMVKDTKLGHASLMLLPGSSVLSLSPEKFFSFDQHAIQCRPMKGTAPAPEACLVEQAKLQLQQDPKNRAENLMIVDLMRNDLAAIQQVAKVSVDALFDVTQFGQVLQMTSDIQAYFAPAVEGGQVSGQPDLLDMLSALFPCGSVTGAPKRKTLALIDQLEPYQRDIYCGALGWVSSGTRLRHDQKLETQQGHDNQQVGQLALSGSFSVPIRTVIAPATARQKKMGQHTLWYWPLQCAVGSGITFDSDPESEWQECLLKSRFFARTTQRFELIETMRGGLHHGGAWDEMQHLAVSNFSAQNGFDTVGQQFQWLFKWIPLLPLHLWRLQSSCQSLGWDFEPLALLSQLKGEIQTMGHHFSSNEEYTVERDQAWRVRVAISQVDGSGLLDFSFQILKLDTFPSGLVAKIGRASTPLYNNGSIAALKSNIRRVYQQSLESAGLNLKGWFDELFIDPNGFVIEGARTALLIKINDEWMVSNHPGAIDSVAKRFWCLGAGRDASGRPVRVKEGMIHVSELAVAEEIRLINALYPLGVVGELLR